MEPRLGKDWEGIEHLKYYNDKLVDYSLYLVLKDFKNFLFIAWQKIGLPEPTIIQYRVADYLQGNKNYVNLIEDKRAVEDISEDENGSGIIISAYRSFGKSFITGAYSDWELLRRPDVEIIVTAADEKKCTGFIEFSLNLLKNISFCSFLVPAKGCTNNKLQIDTPLHGITQSNSLTAIPINSSSLTGRRANIIIGDDLEVPNTSSSLLKRDKLAERVTEFEAVLGDIPDDKKRVIKKKILLGTPQTQETLYMRLIKNNGYEMRIWPARYFNEAQMDRLGHLLCPSLKNDISEGLVITNGHGLRGDMGEPTDSARFTDKDLLKKELGYGYSGFQLQYQLDPSLTDSNRFPLKLTDFIVADVDKHYGWSRAVWTSDTKYVINDLPTYGFGSDYFRRPMHLSVDDMFPFEKTVMAVDPSSGAVGSDETSYCILKSLNGYVYLMDIGGFKDGAKSTETFDAIADKCKEYGVNKVIIESNQGLGMFDSLVHSAMTRKKYHCEIVPWRAIGQKETRIISIVEPLLNAHRIIVDRNLIQNEVLHSPDKDAGENDNDDRTHYSFFYQLTHLEVVKDCLPKDDRIDVFAIALTEFVEDAKADLEAAAKQKELDLLNNILTAEAKGMFNYLYGDGELDFDVNDINGNFFDDYLD